MTRLLLLIAVAALIYLLIKSYRKEAPRRGPPIAEDMVRCAHCGVHLPRSESIEAEGRFFCSAEHRNAHAGDTGSSSE